MDKNMREEVMGLSFKEQVTIALIHQAINLDYHEGEKYLAIVADRAIDIDKTINPEYY